MASHNKSAMGPSKRAAAGLTSIFSTAPGFFDEVTLTEDLGGLPDARLTDADMRELLGKDSRAATLDDSDGGGSSDSDSDEEAARAGGSQPTSQAAGTAFEVVDGVTQSKVCTLHVARHWRAAGVADGRPCPAVLV